jgi:hypothetical protein
MVGIHGIIGVGSQDIGESRHDQHANDHDHTEYSRLISQKTLERFHPILLLRVVS